MASKKYTLPRHTNLAKQSTRTSAFLVDLAIVLALTFFFVFAVFRPIFKKSIDIHQGIIDSERMNSGLYVKNDKGEIETLPGAESYDVYLGPLEYFYLNYLTGNNIENGKSASQDLYTYDIPWFNENVLLIGKEDQYASFEYAKTDGVDDPTKLGILIEGKEESAKVLIQKQYKVAILEVFNNISNVKLAGLNYMLVSTTVYVFAIFCAGVISYVVLPWVLKNGQTLGKKIFKLGLATSNGYRFDKEPKLLMRFVPFVVMDASLMVLVAINLYIVLTIVMIIFLVSFTLAMSSPKRMALHDYCAQTIVVDLSTSTLFNTVEEEEKYIMKEDHLEEEVVVAGEEPELRYEK